MLYEFAITPGLFDAPTAGHEALGRDLESVLEGLCDNGLVADLGEGRWRAEVEQRVPSLPQDVRKWVQTLLETLDGRNRLVSQPAAQGGALGTEVDWMTVALDAHARHPFHGVVIEARPAGQQASRDERVVALPNVRRSPVWARRPHNRLIKRTPEQLREVLEPVLCYARKLWLIDPNMQPTHDERFMRTIRLCSELLGQHRRGRRSAGYVEVHVDFGKRRESVALQRQAWERELRPLHDSYGHRFSLFLWRRRPHGEAERLHDRYIITDQCSLSVPGGLDCRGDTEDTTTVSLLEPEVRDQVLRQYAISSPVFRLADTPCRVP